RPQAPTERRGAPPPLPAATPPRGSADRSSRYHAVLSDPLTNAPPTPTTSLQSSIPGGSIAVRVSADVPGRSSRGNESLMRLSRPPASPEQVAVPLVEGPARSRPRGGAEMIRKLILSAGIATGAPTGLPMTPATR